MNNNHNPEGKTLTAEELFLKKYGNKITGGESWVIRFAEEYHNQFSQPTIPEAELRERFENGPNFFKDGYDERDEIDYDKIFDWFLENFRPHLAKQEGEIGKLSKFLMENYSSKILVGSRETQVDLAIKLLSEKQQGDKELAIGLNDFVTWTYANYSHGTGGYRHRGDFEKTGKVHNLESLKDLYIKQSGK